MRIGVMGAGAIGGYLAARLAAAGQELALVARGSHLAAIRERGLRLSSELGDVHVRPAAATYDPHEIGPVDVLLFTVKLYDAERALDAALPMVGPSTRVVTFQNGVAGTELLVGAFGRERTVGGTAKIPVQIVAPGEIRHPARLASFVMGPMTGRLDDKLAAFGDALGAAGVDVSITDQIERAIWEKFVLLAAFSGVSAVTRGSFATIRGHEATRAMLRDAVHEALAVAAAKDVGLPPDCEQRTLHFLLEVGAPEVKASQTNDLEAGRRLELPWLSGAVVRMGQDLGVPTPTHRFICAALAPFVEGRPS
jgi:2-dehydropantoate 2-reductase